MSVILCKCRLIGWISWYIAEEKLLLTDADEESHEVWSVGFDWLLAWWQAVAVVVWVAAMLNLDG